MFNVTPHGAQNRPASQGAAVGRGHRSCPEQAPAARSHGLPLRSGPAAHVFIPFTQLRLPACLHPATAQQRQLPCQSLSRASRRGWRPDLASCLGKVSVFSTTHTVLIKSGSIITLLWPAGDELWLKETVHADVNEGTNSVSSEGAASKVFSDERNAWISPPRGADWHPRVNGPLPSRKG